MEHHHHLPQKSCSKHNFSSKIDFLDSAARKSTLSPEEVLDLLTIAHEASMLDVGAGSGYLSIPAAQRTSGIVFALDVDRRMLDIISKKAEDASITNIQLLESSMERIPLPDNAVDIALASLVLHEVSSLPAALREINRVLKPNGSFLCLEYENEETPGPPMHMRISSTDMLRALRSAGFSAQEAVLRKDALYIVTAKKAE